MQSLYGDNKEKMLGHKKNAEAYHEDLNKLRKALEETGDMSNQIRWSIEFAIADLRNEISFIRLALANYSLALNREKASTRKSLKWTYKTATEEKENISRDTEEKLLDYIEAYSSDTAWVNEMEDHVKAHIRIAEFAKSCVIQAMAEEKRMRTLLSSDMD